MISILGSLCLFTALLMSVLQCVIPLYGYYRHNHYAYHAARVLTLASAIFVATAYLLLTIAFVTSDFSLTYVAAHSHINLPFLYRLTALWGAHEGSMLLWVMVLQVWSLCYIVMVRNKQNVNMPLSLAVLGGMSALFLLFLVTTSTPFTLSTTPLVGQDLNPLLQDPGFILHPPFLFLGYVGFSVSFAIALSSLLQRNVNYILLVARQFALAAWCFLTIGILLGAWWAYRVLGWGGFWFWDPVENASLLPWLSGIALIHVLVLAQKRPSVRPFALLLAMMTFMLSILGTFLVRSGVLISVHTFASDPSRGVALLLILGLIVCIGLALYLWRFPQLIANDHTTNQSLSRGNWLLLGSVLWLVAMLTVLLGTLYPLIIDVLQLGMLSVGAPYFNSVLLPTIALLLASMSLAMVSTRRGATLFALLKPIIFYWLPLYLMSIALFYYLTHAIFPGFALLFSLSIAVLLSHMPAYRYMLATVLSHVGFAILLVGILLSSVMSLEKEAQLAIGDSTQLGPYHFILTHTRSVAAGNYRGIEATLKVMKQQHEVTTLSPEKRIYFIRDMVISKVDIHPGIFRDLYVALGEPINENTWSLRLYYKPFIRFILFGGVMMALGALFALRRISRAS